MTSGTDETIPVITNNSHWPSRAPAHSVFTGKDCRKTLTHMWTTSPGCFRFSDVRLCRRISWRKEAQRLVGGLRSSLCSSELTGSSPARLEQIQLSKKSSAEETIVLSLMRAKWQLKGVIDERKTESSRRGKGEEEEMGSKQGEKFEEEWRGMGMMKRVKNKRW